MPKEYELMVIFDPEMDDRAAPAALERFLDVLRERQAQIESVDLWGRRDLAYEIKKKSEGIYAVVNFSSSPEAAAELERQLRLAESVLRAKILRAEHAVASTAKATSRDGNKALAL